MDSIAAGAALQRKSSVYYVDLFDHFFGILFIHKEMDDPAGVALAASCCFIADPDLQDMFFILQSAAKQYVPGQMEPAAPLRIEVDLLPAAVIDGIFDDACVGAGDYGHAYSGAGEGQGC